MTPAASPRSTSSLRVLVTGGGRRRVARAERFPDLFEPGDLIVVNDAATMPASLRAHTHRGARVELRLAANIGGAHAWTAAVLGAGDHRLRTEDRPPPPALAPADRLLVDGPEGLVAVVTRLHALSPRLVDVAFELPLRREGADEAHLWAALYRAGRPVQYAHVPRPLALWDVQNAWAGRPWAVEMPSAGRALGTSAIRALRERGAEVASVTHAAGLSSVGDAAIDGALPLPERYEVPPETASAVARARRVIAVGTSVVRALEGSARANGGRLVAGHGVTDLRLGPGSPRLVVDALLTGVHEVETSHFALLGAFAPADVLEGAMRTSEEEGLLAHEFGDAWLIWGQPAERIGRGSGERPRRDMSRRTEAGGAVETHRSSAIEAA